MRRIIFAVLAFTTTATTQPFHGPVWVMGSGPSLSMDRRSIGVRDTNVDLLFHWYGTLYHGTFSAQHGGLYNQTPLPFGDGGWVRTVCDVIETEAGWAALLYDRTEANNRTIVFTGLNSPGYARQVGQGTNWCEGWGYCSENYAMTLARHPTGGWAAAWQFAWSSWNGEWGCAGWGTQLFVPAAGWEQEYPIANEFLGGPEYAFTKVYCPTSDSVVILVGNQYSMNLSHATAENQGIRSGTEFHCLTDAIEALFLPSGRIFVLSRSVASYQDSIHARLIELAGSACMEIIPLDDDPITAASHSNYGMVWLSRWGRGVLLHRVDTTGAEVQPAGAVHWPEAQYAIEQAALAISDSGLIVVVWSERDTSHALPSRLYCASLGWSTYLDAAEPPVAPQPSAFHLSAYPNPFNGVLSIRYNVPRAQQMELAVFNVLGQKVETLFAGLQMAGAHEQSWTPRGAGGLYFVRLQADNVTQTQKVLYLR